MKQSRGQSSPCDQRREELHPIALLSPWETAIELARKDHWYPSYPSQWQITIRRVALSINVSRPLRWSRAQQALTALCHESVCLCQLQPVTVIGRTVVHRLMLWASNLSFPVTTTVPVQWRSECLSNHVLFPQWRDVFSSSHHCSFINSV